MANFTCYQFLVRLQIRYSPNLKTLINQEIMKKLLAISASILGIGAFTGSVHAQIYSVEYNYNTLNPTYSYSDTSAVTTPGVEAGFLPAQYWNPDLTSISYFNPETTGITGGLTDSNGDSSTITETKTDFGGYNAGGAVTGFSDAGDNDLYSGGIYSTTGSTGFSLTLGGLNTADTYNLFLYVKDPNGASGTLVSGTSGTQTYYLTTIGNSSMSSYVEGTALTAGAATAGNYFEFSDLSGSTITAALSSGGVNVSGFQLQQIAAVPEPSTWAMMLGGLGMLAFCVRRKAASIK
jgi:hypothetical protein